jgi:hypothetical protein
VPLVTILTGLLLRTVARTIAAVGRDLTRRRRAVILRRAGVIRPQAVRTRLHRIHRQRLAMDRLAGDGLQVVVVAAEAEAAQDRTAGNS